MVPASQCSLDDLDKQCDMLQKRITMRQCQRLPFSFPLVTVVSCNENTAGISAEDRTTYIFPTFATSAIRLPLRVISTSFGPRKVRFIPAFSSCITDSRLFWPHWGIWWTDWTRTVSVALATESQTCMCISPHPSAFTRSLFTSRTCRSPSLNFVYDTKQSLFPVTWLEQPLAIN